VEAGFDEGLVASDAGALLLGATGRAIGMIDRFAACVHDERRVELIERAVAPLAGVCNCDPVVRYESMSDPADGRMSARTAVRAGVILINGPLIPLMVGPLFIGQWLLARTAPIASIALLLLGLALAWSWWSAGVTLWRGWAARHGVDPGSAAISGRECKPLVAARARL
jgi:hypothetical protein